MLCNLDVGVAIFIDALGANFFVIWWLIAFLELCLLPTDLNAFKSFVPRLMSFRELRTYIAFS